LGLLTKTGFQLTIFQILTIKNGLLILSAAVLVLYLWTRGLCKIYKYLRSIHLFSCLLLSVWKL